jgi:hypothetical protein
MKRIVFYCGVLTDTGEVYVRNAPEYLAMTDPERVSVLTGLIAEMSQELEFVSRMISNREISSRDRVLPQ